MKRNSMMYILAILAMVSFFPVANAQEETDKKIEKRIKIVTVDKNGEKTVIDTTISGDTDLEALHLGEGMKWTVRKAGDKPDDTDNVFILKTDDKDNFSIITVDKEHGKHSKQVKVFVDEDVIHSSEGNVVFKSGKSEGHTYMIKVDDEEGESFSWISDDDNELDEGEVHIVIRSKNDLENLYIKGDAVITIKDGHVSYEGDTVKKKIKEKGDLKVVKEKEAKRVVKK